MIYLDNNATTAVAPEVFEAMRPFLEGEYFNPSSAYSASKVPARAIAESRRILAEALGCSPEEIVFTSCATESNNAAIRGAAAASDRRRIVTTAVEHPAVREVCRSLERSGYEVSWLGVDRRGMLDIAEFVKALRRDTLLVTVMHANNETGVVFPIAEMARIVKETDERILFHTDATQSVGKLPIDLAGEMQHVDMLSLSAHKLHGPKGVGALFVRKGSAWSPFMLGGHQESGRRAGTENVAGIVGLGKAVSLAVADLEGERQLLASMRDTLEERLLAAVPWTEVNGAGAPRLPNTLNVSFHFVEGESILYQLDAAGICASSGSACTSGSLEPSHVLRAMGVPETAIHGSVRFSLSRYNKPEEIERVSDVVPEIVARLRRLSPYWDASRNAPRPDAPAVGRSTT